MIETWAFILIYIAVVIISWILVRKIIMEYSITHTMFKLFYIAFIPFLNFNFLFTIVKLRDKLKDEHYCLFDSDVDRCCDVYPSRWFFIPGRLTKRTMEDDI